MSLEISVTGVEQLNALSRRLREAGREDLDRQLDKAARKAGQRVIDAVERDSDLYMPRGYEKIFRASMNFRTTVRKAHGSRITIALVAKGKISARQVRNLEQGHLRHPVFGRWRRRRGKNRGKHAYRNPWVGQRIRPHFFSEPANDTAPKVREDFLGAMRAVADKITEG